MTGRHIFGSNLIKFDCLVVLVLFSALFSVFGSSSGKKCFNLLTLTVFNLFFSDFSMAMLSLTWTMIARPRYFGANFLFFPMKSVSRYQTCCPMEKLWFLAFLSYCSLHSCCFRSMFSFAISRAFCRIWSLLQSSHHKIFAGCPVLE